MTMYFDDILTSVTARLAHDSEQHFIGYALRLRITDATVVEHVRFECSVLICRANENSLGNSLRVDAANTYDRHTSLTRWRSNRCNRILLVHGKNRIITSGRF